MLYRVEAIAALLHSIGVTTPSQAALINTTSNTISKYFQCVPATITNNLRRYGWQVGIEFKEVLHRGQEGDENAVYKRCWYVDTDSPFYRMKHHICAKRFLCWTFMNDYNPQDIPADIAAAIQRRAIAAERSLYSG